MERNPNREVLTELWNNCGGYYWEWKYGWGMVGRLVGCIAAWPLADRVGRKQALIYSNIFRIIAVCIEFLGIFISYSEKPCKSQNCIGILDYFFCAMVLSEELHSGLGSVLGILYIYEVSPRPSYKTAVASAPVLALHFAVGTGLDFVIVWIIPEMTVHPVNYSVWICNGSVSLTVTILQSWILSKYFPESPGFLAVQQAKVFESKAALEKLRKDADASRELHEIQRDNKTPRGLRRSSYLTEIFIVYLAFHWVLTGLTFYNFQFQLSALMKIYVGGVIVSYILAFIHFSLRTVTIEDLQKELFSSYFILAFIYFLTAVVFLAGNFWKPEPVREYILGLLETFTCILFWKYPGTITILLVCEYSDQKSRSGRIVLGWVFGGFIATGGFLAFAVTGAVAMILVMNVNALLYSMIVYPWIWLGVETARVWRGEARKELSGGPGRRTLGGDSGGSRGIEGHSIN